MLAIKEFFMNLVRDEEGATAVEYAVMLVLIIVVCLAVITTLGSNVKNAFNTVAETLNR